MQKARLTGIARPTRPAPCDKLSGEQQKGCQAQKQPGNYQAAFTRSAVWTPAVACLRRMRLAGFRQRGGGGGRADFFRCTKPVPFTQYCWVVQSRNCCFEHSLGISGLTALDLVRVRAQVINIAALRRNVPGTI